MTSRGTKGSARRAAVHDTVRRRTLGLPRGLSIGEAGPRRRVLRRLDAGGDFPGNLGKLIRALSLAVSDPRLDRALEGDALARGCRAGCRATAPAALRSGPGSRVLLAPPASGCSASAKSGQMQRS